MHNLNYRDYITSFEETSDDIPKILDQYGKERTIQKLYGALDAINIALVRLNGPVKPYLYRDNTKESAA